MKINLSPQRRDDTLAVSKAGDILTINGESFDFTGLPDGATIPAGEVPCDWIVGPVERVSGDLRFALILPHRASPSQAVAFPAPLVDPPDGPLILPFDPLPAVVAEIDDPPAETEEDAEHVEG